MKRAHKPKLLIAALCATMAFNANADRIWGWFGSSAGDDGKASTIGNPNAKININETTFTINNKSFGSINKVEITDFAGKQLYTNQLTCNAGKTCNLLLRNINFKTPVILKFFNNNQLITAYTTGSTPLTTNYLILDDTWLGIYAFHQMAKVTKKSPAILNEELTQFFIGYSSPDKTPDIFEELGLYFIAQNGGKNEKAFYATLNTALNSHKSLPAKAPKAQPRALMSSSVRLASSPKVGGSDTTPVCDPSVQSAFSYIGTIGGMIPLVGDGINAIFDLGGQILSDACPNSENAAILQKLDEIENKLKQFDAKLNELGFKVALLDKLINTNQTENTLQLMDINYSKLATDYFGTYSGVINGSTDLATYVKQNGGLKKAHANSQQIKNLLSSMPTQLNNFDKLLSDDQISKMKISLDNVCKNPTSHGDIIANRINCNVAILKTVTTIDSSALRLKPMLRDEINTINEALKSGDIDAQWLKNNVSENFVYNGQSYTWSTAAAQTDKIINLKTQFVTDTLIGNNGEKIYKPLEGLSTQLTQNMIDVKCGTTNNLPAVLEWHTADTVEPYMVTQCDDGQGTKITSKYYYTKRGEKTIDDKVINAMAVLVPDRFFHGGDQNNYGYSPAFPWADITTLTEASSPNNIFINYDYNIKAYFEIPSSAANVAANSEAFFGNAKSYNIGREPAGITQRVLVAGGGDRYVEALKQETATKFFTNANGKNWFNDNFVILRYTKGLYSYVSVMRNRMSSKSGSAVTDYHLYLDGSPQCLTNDCTISETGAKLDQLKFTDGTSIEWTKTTNETKYSPISGYTINVTSTK